MINNIYKHHYEHVVSLGHACSVASTLERYGFREHSGPFDWQAGRSLKSRIDCINDGFNSFLENLTSDNLLQRQVPSCYYYPICDTFFVHDFNEWDSVETQLERVKRQYKRRIDQFIKDIQEPTLFVYYLYDNDDVCYINEKYSTIIDVLRHYNPLNDILFVSDYKFVINYQCYYVKNDRDTDITDFFVEQNKELEALLGMLDYPLDKRERNLKFYKQKCRYSFFKKAYKKVYKITHRLIYGIYQHNKTWFD